jgi:uncharacterized protein (DUF4415 family)
MTEEELDASLDEAEAGEIDWSSLQVGIPGPKKQLTVRLDEDIIARIKAQVPGYETRMNAALRRYVDAKKREAVEILLSRPASCIGGPAPGSSAHRAGANADA